MDSIDLRDRYPEIERPIRFDGSQESVKKCLEPVIKKLDRILNVIDDIAYWKELEYKNSFVFQSRAMGTCKKTSDIDLYVQLSEIHTELVKTNGVDYKHTGVIILAGEWALKFFSEMPEHLTHELVDLNIDIFWGIEPLPPAKKEYEGRKYYINLEELKND